MVYYGIAVCNLFPVFEKFCSCGSFKVVRVIHSTHNELMIADYLMLFFSLVINTDKFY